MSTYEQPVNLRKVRYLALEGEVGESEGGVEGDPVCHLLRGQSPCTLHPTPCTLHPAPYTLHPASCTLHPAPYTLHPTLCTLRPAPCTLVRYLALEGEVREGEGVSKALNVDL